MLELQIACTLGPAALKARREGLLADLWRRAADHEQNAQGLRLCFPADADVLATITRAVDAERQCCRFLRFQVTVEPDGGPVWLDLTGPPGTGEFLSALIES